MNDDEGRAQEYRSDYLAMKKRPNFDLQEFPT